MLRPPVETARSGSKPRIGEPHLGASSTGGFRNPFESAAEPIDGFPTLAELLYDIGMVLAVMLGLAALAGAALQA